MKRKMKRKIIFICPYYTQKRTAASTYIDNLLDRIPKELEYVLYCRATKPSIKNTICLEKLPIYRLIGYRLYAMILAVYYSTIRRHIVITDSNPIISLPLSVKIYHIIHHINDIPILANISKGNSYTNKSPVINKFDIVSVCWRLLLFFSPKDIITVSNSERMKIKKLYNNKNINVIRNINQFESIQLNKSGEAYNKHDYDIIMIGHYVKRKNYELALKAIESTASLLRKTIRLCIIGNETAEIAKMNEYRGISIDCFSGLDKEEMIKYVVKSRFYLNTSYLEGYCIPYIECQSLGLIPIVPNQEIFHENCFSKEVYFCEYTLNSFTENMYKAISLNLERTKPSLQNIDGTKQSRLLNKNVISKIDNFMAEIVIINR